MDGRSAIVFLLLICFAAGVLPQYREKNISGDETDAVQALLARYLQRRLQSATQLSTPPPPSVLFNAHHQAKVRQASHRSNINSNPLPRNASEKDDQDHLQDYDDYEDDLEGFEDSERSRTRFDLLAGNSIGSNLMPIALQP